MFKWNVKQPKVISNETGISPKKFGRNISIRSRILGLFIVLIFLSIIIVASTTYYIGQKNIQHTTETGLNNSVRSVLNQISLLSGAYTSRQFSDKLSYTLTDEQAAFTQAGLDAKIYLVNSSGFEINRANVYAETTQESKLPDNFIKEVLLKKNGNNELVIDGITQSVAYGYILEKDWIYAVAVSKSSSLKVIYQLQAVTIISGLVSIFLALIFSFVGTKGIIKTLEEINKTVSIADTGDLMVRAEAKHGGPELRDLAANFNIMLSNFENLILEIGLSIEELTASSKNLSVIAIKSDESTSNTNLITQKMAKDSAEQELTFVQIMDSTNKMLETITHIINQVGDTAKSSKIMMGSVYEGLEAVQELNGTITQIEQVADNTVHHIKILESRSDEINKITNTIKGISAQTKLLSINASIEAANAGKYGASFTVVANEIQKLAQSSAESAFEVSEIIKEIHQDTAAVLETANKGMSISHSGAVIALKTDESFKVILKEVTQTHEQIVQIADNASEISVAMQQFSDNIETIYGAIQDTVKNSQEVAVTVENHQNLAFGITDSSKCILDTANKLNTLKDKFQITGS